MSDFGTLTDYETGEQIRPATAAEWRKTADLVNDGTSAGATGAFDLDGRAVWVEGGPAAEAAFYSIRDLRDEAGQAGDMEMARICDIALGEGGTGEFAELLGQTVDGIQRDVIAAMDQGEARAECVRIILDNRLNTAGE